MSKKLEAKSLGITFRPRSGLSSLSEERLIKWLKKQDYGELVAEKEGHERHCHIQIWNENPVQKDSVRKAMNRILTDTVEFESDTDRSNQLRHAIDIKMCYNDWLANYCIENIDKKDEASAIRYSSIPDDTTSYYPSEEEQKFIQASATAVDGYMFKLEQKFLETEKEPTKDNIAEFLSDMMFNQREIQTMRKKIDRINLCDTLFNYINKVVDKKLFLGKEEKTEQQILEETIEKKMGLEPGYFKKKNSNDIV